MHGLGVFAGQLVLIQSRQHANLSCLKHPDGAQTSRGRRMSLDPAVSYGNALLAFVAAMGCFSVEVTEGRAGWPQQVGCLSYPLPLTSVPLTFFHFEAPGLQPPVGCLGVTQARGTILLAGLVTGLLLSNRSLGFSCPLSSQFLAPLLFTHVSPILFLYPK